MAKGIFADPIGRAKKISESHKKGKHFACLVCNTLFWRKPSEIVGGDCKFCTRDCYAKWQKGKPRSAAHKAKCRLRVGAKNPNWRGGIVPVHKKFRASEEYKQWRTEVFERDNYTCQECGARSKSGAYVRIEAHHIRAFSLFPELRLVVTNGLTLCKPCHSMKPKGRQLKPSTTAIV